MTRPIPRPGMPAPIASMHTRMSREQRKSLVALERSRWGRHHRLATTFVREIFDDDLLGLAAELSYRWLFALFPAMIMLVAMSRWAAESLSVTDPRPELIAERAAARAPTATRGSWPG